MQREHERLISKVSSERSEPRAKRATINSKNLHFLPFISIFISAPQKVHEDNEHSLFEARQTRDRVISEKRAGEEKIREMEDELQVSERSERAFWKTSIRATT